MFAVIPEPFRLEIKGKEAVFTLTESVNIDFCK